MNIYKDLQNALSGLAEEKGILDSKIEVKCKALTAKEAIGETEHNDYPIHKGKEVMVEATYCSTQGQAFTDQYESNTYTVRKLVNMNLDNNKNRASFISSLNAIWKYYGKTEKTVHCRDKEPVECAKELYKYYDFSKKTLLIGLQPRFLEVLSQNGDVRVLDLDQDNIGKQISGVKIEDGEIFDKAVEWCDQIFATGSTLCNGTLENILKSAKPVIFFGVTIAATAEILGLKTYCIHGH